MKFSLIVLFAVATYLAIASADLDSEWADFKKNFTKTYDEAEDKTRKEIFTQNLAKVEEHNKKYEAGEITYSIGVNQFSDLTSEERQKLHGHGVILPSAPTEE